METFLERIKLGTANTKLINWPGTNEKVAMKILSEQDRMEIDFSVDRLYKSEKVEVNLITTSHYEPEKFVQILFRCLRCPDDLDRPLANSITDFRRALTREDTKVLISEYVAFEQECSPSPENLSPEDFDKLLLEVKKNPDTTIGNITNLTTAKKLLLTLAVQPPNLPPDNG